MAPAVARRARRGVRFAPPVESRTRSAENWWWDRLAPSGSGYHLLQSDSMLLVIPGPGPSRPRAQRRAAGRAQRLRPPGSRAAEAKAKPRTAPAPAPAPQQVPDPGWGDRIPLEILLQIFGLLVVDGPMPFLGRAARVCRRWHEAASQPVLWHTLTLSPPLAGRPAKNGAKAEKKLLASLEWLMPNRFSQLQRLTLIHWKSQVHSVLKLVSEFCPRLAFLRLSDCHGVTPDTLVTLARACPELHSLDLQHSTVESTAVVSFLEEAGPRIRKLWLTCGSQTTAILGALRGSCPRLQVLEVSAGISDSHTPLQLPVEALQKGCPRLQVLRLLNLMWLPKPSGRAVTPGPGFPSLEELCLASSTCNFVTNEVLDRLLHGSPNLRLLDLRGCLRVTPAGLYDLPCQGQHSLGSGWQVECGDSCPRHSSCLLLTARAGGASPGPVRHVGSADSSKGGQPSADPQVGPHSAGTGLVWPGLQREGPGAGLSCLFRHPCGLTPGPVLPQPQGHPGHTKHNQLSDQQLPGSAVPQPGVLPLPSEGPETGLQGSRGNPVVPGAAAHQPTPSMLGSSR
uniref:F-box and leucine rich repeat protein 6 n=1 Tax=Catagonus wagneri TaxID=51154 RepID=A0A8C3WB07_9CETA